MTTTAPGLDADSIAAAVLACPSVAGLYGGRFGEIATYLPGRRVTGVRITPVGLFVHLIAQYPATIAHLDSAVRAAVAPHVGALPVTVVVEDLSTDTPEMEDSQPHSHQETAQ